MAQYLVVSNVKKLAKRYGKRVGKDFISGIDAQIEHWIMRACEIHNGGKKTLDASIAAFSRKVI